MKVTAVCPKCLAKAAFDAATPPETLACGTCGETRAVTISAAMREGTVDVCALCGCGHFYVEKDFNAWAGGAIMLAAAAGFLWAQSFNLLLAFSFLAAAALLDLLVFAIRPLRTICYRCLATYRGGRPNPAHRPYDLGLAGRYTDDYEERRNRGA